MAKGLLAGFASPQQFEDLCRRHDIGPQSHQCEDGRIAFLSCDEPNSYTTSFDAMSISVRGYAVLPGKSVASSAEEFAQYVQQQYSSKNSCSLVNCEGSFSVVVVDTQRGQLHAYRNIANNRFTYVAEADSLTIIGSNLATLAASLPNLSVSEAELPSYFLFRFSPGKQTLLKNVWRLLPGQTLRIERDKVDCQQVQTFRDITQPVDLTHTDAVDQVGQLFDRIHADVATQDSSAATLLSGGVDSCTLHAHWMKYAAIPPGRAASMSITTDAPETQGDTRYALSAAKFFSTQHETVETSGPYADYLIAGIQATGEPPNHVQGVFYRELAREMKQRGIQTGLNGEGADCLFGTPMTDVLRRAKQIRRLVPTNAFRHALQRAATIANKPYWSQAFQVSTMLDETQHRTHPVNLGSVWTNYESLDACFGSEAVNNALAVRRKLLDQYHVANEPLNLYHEQTMLGEVVDSATLWTSVFHEQGVDMICPFLDSRMIKFVLSLPLNVRFQYKQPKQVLKDALLKFMPRKMVFREKLAFGQPIFEWMKPNGQLREMIEQIETDRYPFLPTEVLEAEKSNPTWFLFSLLCYDIWHRQVFR